MRALLFAVLNTWGVAGDPFEAVPLTQLEPTSISRAALEAAYSQSVGSRRNVAGKYQVTNEDGTARVSGAFITSVEGQFKYSQQWWNGHVVSVAFDGDVFSRYQGDKAKGAGRGEVTYEKLEEEPLWGGVLGVSDGFLARQIPDKRVDVQVKGELVLNGEHTVVVELRPQAKDASAVKAARLFLSLTKDLLPVRREEYDLQGNLQYIDDQYEYETVASGDGVGAWWPTHVRTRLHTAEGKIDTTEYRATDVSFNATLERSAFAVDWPEGTKVNDATLNEVYVVGQVASPSDLRQLSNLLKPEASKDYAPSGPAGASTGAQPQPRANAPGAFPTAQGKSPRSRRVVLAVASILGVVLVGGIGAGLLVKRR